MKMGSDLENPGHGSARFRFRSANGNEVRRPQTDPAARETVIIFY